MRVETMTPASGGGDRDWLVAALRDRVAAGPAERTAIARGLASALPVDELCRFVAELESEAWTRRRDTYESHLREASVAAERGNLEAAGQAAQSAVRVDGVRWEAHRLLGEVAERRGAPRQARERYAVAVHLGWDDEDARRTIERLDAPRPRPRRAGWPSWLGGRARGDARATR
ncbi:MAG TPA: hypothetical protein VFQ38_13685 [Longimicrobiales bacterium]|nr:hypothetical protein [Longimicrobiales bacterium]